MKIAPALLLLSVLIFSGCQSRSISNSGYRHDYRFQGELSELEVLGVDASKDITEDQIRGALKHSGSIQLKKGDRIVLVQSGAQFPDSSMVTAAESYFTIIPLSGIPRNPSYKPQWSQAEESQREPAPLDKALRLAAARASAKTLIVYWGVLESAREGYATKTVSWVPVVGSIVPDEDQRMRIRLKAAVIDVESGHWEMLTPEVYDDERTSARINRQESDQQQVELLKEKAYRRLIADLQTRYL